MKSFEEIYQNVNPRLIIKKYKDTVFYLVQENKGIFFKVVPGILDYIPYTETYRPYMFRPFDANMKLKDYQIFVDWENLFFTKKEADDYCKYKNDLMNSFQYKPFVKFTILDEHKDVFHYIENMVNKLLKDFPNFEGVDFCDVSANGIQVRTHHKAIKDYVYGKQFTIKYDFSNVIEDNILDFVLQIVKEFIRNDTEERINSELNFIKEGEKYNWN